MNEVEKLVQEKDAIVLYFSHDGCSVCKVLKPKVKELIEEKYPKSEFAYINTVEQPEIAASYQVFAVPTVLVYFQGKEYYRFSRNIGLTQIDEAIARPYQLLF
nr:thioredoxin family protein [uncultured Carboxylicivirga sp.]